MDTKLQLVYLSSAVFNVTRETLMVLMAYVGLQIYMFHDGVSVSFCVVPNPTFILSMLGRLLAFGLRFNNGFGS